MWGRREVLPSSHGASSSSQQLPPGDGERGSHREQRTDPWSVRMRSKYGLDVDDFTYDPARGQRSPQAPVVPPPRMASNESRRCAVM